MKIAPQSFDGPDRFTRHVSYGEILEQSFNEILLFDAVTLKFIHANAAARDNLQYSMDELKGLTPLDVKPELDKERFNRLSAPLRSGESQLVVFDTHHLRKDGSTYPVEVRLQLLCDAGQSLFIAISNDITERRCAEKELQKKTTFLQLQHVITRAANEAESLDEAMQTALDEICAQAKWPVGHLYLLDRSSGDLEPTQIWHFDDTDRFQTFRNVTESTRFASGVGLPGRVLASGKPAWIIDVTRDRNFPRAVKANDIGVKTGCAFPLLMRREVVGVLEFFSAEAAEADESLLELMAQIGTQLGRVIERRHAAHALKESEQRFRELTERVRVLPWEVDPKTWQFTYVGPQCVEILGYPQKLWYEKDFWVKHMHPQDRQWALDYCIECAATQDHYEFEYRMVNAQEGQVWFQDIVNVVRNAYGPKLLRGFMIDITERKHDEAKRAAAMGRFARLTPREQEVMALVVAGHSNKQSAAKLKSSPRTVDVHRARVMEKMDASSLPDLVAMAITCGVYEDGSKSLHTRKSPNGPNPHFSPR